MTASRSHGESPAEGTNRRLACTINLGLFLGAPEERAWTIDVTEDHLDRCADAGFSAIRLCVGLGQHRTDSDSHPVASDALDRIDRVARAATERGLAVVVAGVRDPAVMADPPRHRDGLLAQTLRLAEALAHHGPDVILEPLAEPHGALDAVWNEVLHDLCSTVRQADPGRTLVAGPRGYNNARFLGELSVPEEERNLIVTIHQYWPIRFTMQGETWLGPTELGDPASWLGTTWDGTPEQRAELEGGFDGVAAFARASGRPVFVGEFGTSDNADVASRVRWTAFNRELAERHGFSWGLWSFGPSFALYDLERDRWNEELLGALGLPSRRPRR